MDGGFHGFVVEKSFSLFSQYTFVIFTLCVCMGHSVVWVWWGFGLGFFFLSLNTSYSCKTLDLKSF